MTKPKMNLAVGFSLALLIRLCPVGFAAESGEWQEKQTFSIDPQEANACVDQMNRIYGAIQQFYKQRGQLPDRLSQLIPDFIHDPGELVCPYVRKTGDLTGWRRQVDQTVFDDPGSSYAYEFSNKRSNWAPTMTAGEIKQHHMKFFGFGMPVVRCFAHRPRLNLAYGGTVYESGFEWEDAYLTCGEQRQTFHETLSNTNAINTTLLAASLPGPAYMDLTAQQLNLTTNYTAPLFHLCRMDRRGHLRPAYPMNGEYINGLLFDVRGLIHLGGEGFPLSFPLSVDPIEVGAKCHRLHFLHGTVPSPHAPRMSIPAGSTNAVYTISFSDGETAEFNILYGRDVKTLWFNPDVEPASTETKPAWVCPVPGTRTALRLYLTTWTNPRPDQPVRTIRIQSRATNCAPLLVAITLDETEGERRNQ